MATTRRAGMSIDPLDPHGGGGSLSPRGRIDGHFGR